MSARPVLAITIAVAIAPSRAAAEVQPIAIEYVAPRQCPDEISLRAGVIARLGHDPFKGEAPRRALIDVQPTAAGFVAAIELREPGREATRRAVGPTLRCEDAVDALELALAVIIDPTHAQSAQPPPQQPPQQPVAYPPPGWNTAALPPPPKELRRHELGITIGVVSGTHPESQGYFGLRAGYLISTKWRIGLVGRISSGSGMLTQDANGHRTYQTRISEISVETCRRHRFVMLCALLGAADKSVNIDRYDIGVGTTEVADYSDPFAVIGANLSLEVPLGNAFLRPMIEAALALPNVPIESEGLRHVELTPFQLSFDLALGYRW